MMERPLSTATPPHLLRSRLRIKHIELFRHLCEMQSLRKAAEASSMTQPAATKLIQDLESMFGVPLFVRDRRGMRMTAHGELIRRHFTIVMSDVGNMCNELALFATGGIGEIRLGVLPSLSIPLLARVTEQLMMTHPQVSLALTEAPTNRLVVGLQHNELDLIFGRVLSANLLNDFRVVEVYSESFDVVSAAHHPLARQDRVGWTDLCSEKWVLPAAGSPLREMADHLFTLRGLPRPNVVVAFNSFSQVRTLIGGSRLIGLMPRSLAQQGEASGELARLLAADRGRFPPISLISRKDLEQAPHVRTFEALVLRTAAELAS
ncbi:LysR family transcriptional regulator [Bordetella genomosp. 12]|uniref:LysR family transcriptional regulator n=1 Tax=Bordetella genomosp. 12 TaxID=463035 RepID=A0A261VGM2_9BORD|nr:LysR family transcriptional regulator [Bordetella genomosp. 12]OZI72303.1 LysR family transcriptional regulator [Bordetella genomosp. 12]